MTVAPSRRFAKISTLTSKHSSIIERAICVSLPSFIWNFPSRPRPNSTSYVRGSPKWTNRQNGESGKSLNPTVSPPPPTQKSRGRRGVLYRDFILRLCLPRTVRTALPLFLIAFEGILLRTKINPNRAVRVYRDLGSWQARKFNLIRANAVWYQLPLIIIQLM